MNELVVLQRGDKSLSLYLDKVDSGPLIGWIGLKRKTTPVHGKNPFIFLESTKEKLIQTLQRSCWEIVEGLGTKREGI